MSLPFIEILLGNLYISNMDNQEKKDDDKKQNKFLLPFSPNTPRIEQNYNSSVFFTPPYSNEGPPDSARWAPSRLVCKNEKIPFDLSIDLEEFKDKFDILRGLSNRKMDFTVCNIIFGFLDDLSLCRASQVSKTWRNLICVKNSESKKRVRDYISKQKEYRILIGKENVGLQKRLRTNDAARSIIENTPEINTPKIFKTNDGQARSGDFNASDSYRPCPKCSSPAKINNEEHSATCSSCSEEFCLNCFKKWSNHKSENCSTAKSKNNLTSQKGKQKKYLSGTKQSRNRLRRLSSQSK